MILCVFVMKKTRRTDESQRPRYPARWQRQSVAGVNENTNARARPTVK